MGCSAHQPYQGRTLHVRRGSRLFGEDRFRAQLFRIVLRPLTEQPGDKLSAFTAYRCCDRIVCHATARGLGSRLIGARPLSIKGIQTPPTDYLDFKRAGSRRLIYLYRKAPVSGPMIGNEVDQHELDSRTGISPAHRGLFFEDSSCSGLKPSSTSQLSRASLV